jgi:hypothetical protein
MEILLYTNFDQTKCYKWIFLILLIEFKYMENIGTTIYANYQYYKYYFNPYQIHVKTNNIYIYIYICYLHYRATLHVYELYSSIGLW